jgi:tRNA pseudouridine38-40 synthase
MYKNRRYYYLINLQFLGFRFSGWQKQTNSKTLQEMFEKTLFFILKHNDFKTLGAGRTDAMVSANEFLCELFI